MPKVCLKAVGSTSAYAERTLDVGIINARFINGSYIHAGFVRLLRCVIKCRCVVILPVN